MKLRRENKKALQMIKGCMKKIQQQDKEIKKVKLVSQFYHLYRIELKSRIQKFRSFKEKNNTKNKNTLFISN